MPRILTALLVLTALAACSQDVKLVRMNEGLAEAAAPYQRLLVIAVAATEAQRLSLEDEIVGELAARDVDAVAGYTLTGKSTVVRQDEIDAAVTEAGADSILVAHITGTRSNAEVVPGRVETKVTCRGGNPVDLFLYDYEELKEPGTISVSHEIVILTSLYDARQQVRVWMVQSSCAKVAGFDEILADEARAIAEQLTRDGLVE